MSALDSIERTSYIDSRNLIKRLDELDDIDAADLDENEIEERDALRAVCDEGADNFSDWQHGETLIRDSDFEDYARELAEDIGALPKDAAWPASYIDWTAAADALKEDYSSIEIDGTTYWGRS